MSGEQSEQELAAEAPKRGRGREPGFRMSQEHRDKIRNSNILSCLLDHIEGRREMSSTQVSAGLGLLKKVLPDLQGVSISGDEDGPPVETVTTIKLIGYGGS